MGNFMISYIIKILLLIYLTEPLGAQKFSRIEHRNDNILCRSCGADIASSKHIFSKSSPYSHYSFHDSLFNEKDVLVQMLSSDIFFTYPVITTALSACVGVGEWEENDTWFPGYHWKPCVCPECGEYLGWVFEPISPNLDHLPSAFFGFILTSLISETCKYFLHMGVDLWAVV